MVRSFNLESSIESKRSNVISVGLFIPTQGAAGIWGPSCRSCAELAMEELNNLGGINGREVILKIVDAGDTPDAVARSAEDYILDGEIDAVVGMHTSDVRQALAEIVENKIPYIYTPLYEGGETTPGIYCIGETPLMQMAPAVQGLSDRYNLRQWFLAGNDYVWPRTSNAIFKSHITHRKIGICGEKYLPFGISDFDPLLHAISESASDAVLVSFVGDDAIGFNKAFSRSGLSRKILRLSCAIEENVLLGTGENNTDGLFAVSGYFSTAKTTKNGQFRERFHSRFGARGPQLNSIGQSLYEGMYFLKALSDECQNANWRNRGHRIRINGARNSQYSCDGGMISPVYLAEAKGHEFDVVDQYPATA